MSWGPMEELSALFAPGMRHEQQRRQDLEMLREDEGNSTDPPTRVDLDKGVAVIRLPQPGEDPPAALPPAEPARTTPKPVTKSARAAKSASGAKASKALKAIKESRDKG